MPTLNTECSLDLGCPIAEFSRLCDRHSDRTVVVYANTSTGVKARADWMVTSGIAVKVIRYLKEKGQKILWAPDRYLGEYVRKMTGADMLIWPDSCVLREAFGAPTLARLKTVHPDAAVLVHPKAPDSIVALADAVGSTCSPQIFNPVVFKSRLQLHRSVSPNVA